MKKGKMNFIIFTVLFALLMCGCATLTKNKKTSREGGNVSDELINDVKKKISASSLKSDIPDPDPSLVQGTLPNGFRYVLLENTTPEKRVSMHLDIQVGSMHEKDEQRGIAHFLEHMLFNGSTHFEPGELVEYFQSIGMRFGADANAHTGFYETVYDIFLPSGEQKNIDDGLLVLSDYAEGALLLESEVERERGVILAEKRERDSVSYRTFKAGLEFELPGSRITERLPIGTESVIQNTDRALLKSFYDTWYRPENMILVMVGDFDTAIAENLIEKHFAEMIPRAAAAPQPENIWQHHSGIKPFYYYEQEAGNTDVSISTVTRIPFREDTVSDIKERTVRNIAESMVQSRLSRNVREKSSPVSDAGIYSGTYLRNVYFAGIDAETTPDRWDETLELLEKTLRKALEFGFTEIELERAKADFLQELESAVKTASSRETTHLARMIISQINRKRVFQSPKQELELLKPVIEGLTLEDVNRAFKETWKAGHRLVQVTGNTNLQGNKNSPEAIILKVYNRSNSQTVSGYKSENNIDFPYLPAPSTPGKIINRNHVEDLGLVTIDFENGVRLNLKQTDFKQSEFVFRVDFGDGKSAEPESAPGLSMLCENVVNESGLGSLDRDQLEDSLAGRDLDMRFDVGERTFSFSGSGDPMETELLFQLLHAYIMDTGFRQEAFDLSMQRYRQMHSELQRMADGMMELKGVRFLAGGDTRFGMPEPKILEAITLSDVKDWLLPYLKQGKMEISIAGDFDMNHVIKAAGKYMGSLPRRSGGVTVENRPLPHFPEGKDLTLEVDTKIDKALVTMAFPTDDFWDIGRTRRLNVLSTIFSERLRKTIREKIGASYSPHAYNRSSLTYDGYGILRAVVAVAPEMTDAVAEQMAEIATSLHDKGVAEKELTLAIEPVLTHIRDILKTNDYWLESVLSGCRDHPEKFEWARNMYTDYGLISPAEISQLARKYCLIDKRALVVIHPRK